MPKELRDPTLPAEHLGQIPAGHSRDEENRRRTDNLAERAEKEASPFERIDEAKFTQTDNEIVQSIVRHPDTGVPSKEITGRQAGYIYAWLKNPATCRTIEGEMAADAMVQQFFAVGGEWVDGDMPEARELKSKGKENLSSRRGWGDTLLARIKRDFWDANERAVKERERRRGLIEQETVNRMMAAGFTGSADLNHPAFRRSVPNPAEPVTQTYAFNEGDLTRGSIRDSRTGRTLEPGFERR